MEDWLTYRLSDLLLFSPRTYYRLFALYNRDLWPVHLLSFGAGVGSLLLLRRRSGRHATFVIVLLSAVWIWVAWAFHLERYATINWAARYFAVAFVLQAALMLWLMLWHGAHARGMTHPRGRSAADVAALGVTLFALFIQPLIGPLVGREWTQLETFGAAPDPTAVATLGMLPLVSQRVPSVLLVVPVVWCAISGATAWAMGSPDALLVPFAGLTGTVIALRARRT
jgi:hypothetical protein